MVIKPEYDATEAFYEGLARVSLDGKFGYINKSGKRIIPLKFANAYSFFSNGLAIILDENQMWGLINKKGEVIIKPQFVNPFQFDKFGFATVEYTDKHSYKKGKLETYEKALLSKQGKVVWYSGEKLILK